jgi:hypothetical protein
MLVFVFSNAVCRRLQKLLPCEHQRVLKGRVFGRPNIAAEGMARGVRLAASSMAWGSKTGFRLKQAAFLGGTFFAAPEVLP